ncbi:hypothetical protein A2223_05045 [Candidatus Falkowbacteria bacterium RIFOXYA2_FULL_35_8]|nr:MAG: hypothetical protein A2223_05045 [Candidatus Falkowbacteria bacterium RIFOXYA2_FULL_35_8]
MSGVKVDDLNLSGMTPEQAEQIIGNKISKIYDSGLKFKYNEVEKDIPIIGENNLVIINVQKIIAEAYNTGRNGNIFIKNLDRLQLVLFGKTVQVNYELSKNKLQENLIYEFAGFASPAKNSEPIIQITNEKNKKYTLDFSEESAGTTFNFNKSFQEVEQQISQLENNPIQLVLISEEPTVTKAMAEKQEDEIRGLIDKFESLTFDFEDNKYEVLWKNFIYWIILTKQDDEALTTLNPEIISGQLEAFGQQIEKEPRNAKFQMKDGRVTEFEASETGVKILKDESIEKIKAEIFKNGNFEIEIVTEKTEPAISMDTINDYGIKELVGVGKSNFSGSPANRRHNIGVGAAALNGVLIAPGEEFSLVKALGNIDGSNGYLPELVIKGNKTIPEYGGGLCQVGTTIFRAALDTGVNITERKNHSYRVSYYEPAGTDATIYSPKPDFRFVNDTAKHILIQTKIEGNELIFEIYGTDDGRTVEQTYPQIFNITSPGPTKYIDSEDLAPGQTKCIESAHAGADAVFYRTITYATGEEKTETYRSHYVPWQQVCLRGVDPVAKEAEAKEKIAEQTPPTIE